MIDPNTTVAELSTRIPHATRVFEKLGIDYCCGGAQRLAEACARSSLEVGEVVRELEEANTPARELPKEDSIVELVDHIINTHHAFTRSELARLGALADKVLRVHGARHPELARLRELVVELANELLPHMIKEERVLFPYLVALETGAPTHVPFASAEAPMRVMRRDHELVGQLLRAIRAETRDFEPPPDACASYRELFEALHDLEADVHEHVHLENNVLFPLALSNEAR
jgi:regulator of cell morphogenesis and NO signaling